MYRSKLMLIALSTTLGLSVGTVHAESSLRDALTERLRLSQLEVNNSSYAGALVKKGTVLRLRADGIPANALRFVQLNTKSPRFHVRDYARVEVRRDGAITAGPGAMSLGQGTRLVVLDLEASGDRVRVFAHTVDPVPLSDGKMGYGCTEFVFTFDPGALDRADIATVAGRIDQVLAVSSNG